MDALLASDSKREFDLEAMSPGALEEVIHEAHVLRLRAAALEFYRVISAVFERVRVGCVSFCILVKVYPRQNLIPT
jgi:hypothetical protein